MPTLAPGNRLGPFDLVSLLGAGGMGQVWLAIDSRLGRNVAIKVISEDLAGDEQIRARMQREARSVSALNHPNICSLFDIGNHEGADYLVMEYVEGATLRDRIDAGPIPFEALLNIAEQLIEALREAHSRGVTHRDLKPENIMITKNGLVKVLDFGLSKQHGNRDDDATAVRSASGAMIGTLAYMSPEQASGLPADARSDIFNLGVVLYEMAAGARPFEGTPAQIASQLLNSDPRPVRTLNPKTPVRLERMIARCMRKAPDERYQSASELLAELRSASGGKRTSMTPKAASKKAKVDSVAVFPFANRTGDPQLDYLSDGISEGVLHKLSRVGDLRVLARSTTFRYRDVSDPLAAGRELKVRAVLTGEVSMRRGSVAVSAELIDVKTGAHLWGGSYADAEAQKVEETIAQEASESLDARSVVRAKRATVDDQAYRLYLRGRHALNKWSAESLRSAIRSFQEAIDREPSFALGFAGLADAYVQAEVQSESVSAGSLAKARAAARRALQIDDSIAEAHTSLAMAESKDWNWDAAERGFQRAIEINANYETAYYWYSMYLVTRGRVTEALEQVERAHDIDPLSAPIAAHLAVCKGLNGRVDEAFDDLKQLEQFAPDTKLIHQWMAFIHYLKNEVDLAVASARREVEFSNDGNVALANLGFYTGRNGGVDEARAILQRLLARDDVRPFWLAGAYAGLRDTENVLRCLEKGVASQDRGPETTYITWPPWFDAYKDEPRFIAILKRMGLA